MGFVGVCDCINYRGPTNGIILLIIQPPPPPMPKQVTANGSLLECEGACLLHYLRLSAAVLITATYSVGDPEFFRITHPTFEVPLI